MGLTFLVGMLGAGEPLLSAAAMRGNAELPLTGEIKTGVLAVQVDCRGGGTLEVTVVPVGLTFPSECVAGDVRSTYNEIRLHEARGAGSVRVTAPSGVRWALTVEQPVPGTR
ncbi:hypothetical protein [uncultured Streptomyces sp.]|uniref:hypothetical protein n=1 Tax=uncultured Streptomyces sp. TaxID=174707 RepID=UPI00261534D6|nr:hypothetical protein [uncultured Streptomyces sp.]